MKLTLVGYGFVGKAVHALLEDHYEISIVDPAYTSNEVKNEISDGYIICLPTPSGFDGSCDMSIINEMLEQISKNKGGSARVLIKSTISLEGWEYIDKTYSHLEITFSPEFLTAANAVEDFRNQDTILFGSNTIDTLVFGSDPADKFWVDVFTKCKDFTPIYSSIPDLIITKYVRNSFLATKVAFFNEIYDLCREMNDIDYDEIASLVGLDTRIGKSHMQVPGPDGNRGFGGACFPKDTRALYNSAKLKNCSLDILHAVITSNERSIKDNV